ncbi:MAG: cytochrome C [Chlorobi bacterium]|nr:cytochrome C [Chlorobiota bacterium]
MNIWAQISPGDLTSAHKSLEGISHCTKCHILGDKVENKKCLDCHTEINQLINSNKGYHSSSEVKNKECVKCHGEHFGRDFTIIRFNKKIFDHTLTGFTLKGKHKKIKCESCHQSKFIESKKLKDRKNTYLGLHQNCQSCHEDYHQGTLKNSNCQSCHNTEKWRPTAGFNHAETKFKLTGAHKNIKCEQCHKIDKRNGKEFQNFRIAKFGQCIDCHKDIHLGKFGDNCTQCHTTQSFKSIKNDKKFDHSKTGFILKDAHNNLKCNQCHIKGVSVKLKSKNCYDCHTDYHKGEFTKNGIQQDCSVCHTESSFTPSHFTLDEHSKTKFALLGGHLAVPCGKCHLNDSKWTFTFKNTECITCHENIHGDLILKYSDEKGLCVKCHNSGSWDQVNFDHDKTEFKLIEKHEKVKCSNCHFIDNQQSFIFSKLSHDCKTCHKDQHNGQFEADYLNDCSKCHSPNDWSAVNFDHDQARFKLDGSHKNLSCNKCHKEEIINGNKIVKYKFKDITCKSCHL